MVSLGTIAPFFNLPDTVSGKNISLNDVKGNTATVIMFICNHCPFVVHVNDELVKLANDYRNKGVGFVAIRVGGFWVVVGRVRVAVVGR